MIELHPIAIIKCQSLINLGAFLCLFPLSLYERVSNVNENLEKNELFSSDIEDLVKLARILIDHSQVSDLLKQDISDLISYLTIKIHHFSNIHKPCTRYTKNLGI
jgi:hypothetical protein